MKMTLVITVSYLVLGCVTQAQVNYEYRTFENPGATVTLVFGLNDHGDLVGADNTMWKSNDAGDNWNPTSVPAGGSGSVIQVDTTTNPSTIYLAGPSILKSVDGGDSWIQLTGASMDSRVNW